MIEILKNLCILGVLNPHIAYILHLKHTKKSSSHLIIGLMQEVLQPTVILAFRFVLIPVLITPTCHIVVTGITTDTHQAVKRNLIASDTSILHMSIHILLEVILHIYSTHKVILVELLKFRFQLGVTYISLVSVIRIRIAMSHKEHSTFSSLIRIVFIQELSHILHFILCAEKWSTQSDMPLIEISQIAIIKITKAIIGKILDVIDHTCKFLTRNHLKRLHCNILIFSLCQSVKPKVGSIIVASCNITLFICVLARSSTVDADSRTETHINVTIREFLLINSPCFIKCQESIVPS